ncbi:hypothetical protein ON05_019840 [Acaryochloris sp. CCMEE 5410]|nr:hypothetical protein ON05_019840 [Acaryochloris sp. CCMEE 5410]
MSNHRLGQIYQRRYALGRDNPRAKFLDILQRIKQSNLLEPNSMQAATFDEEHATGQG